ncbi:MAG: hypothetical protein FWF50_01510 [Defluviitaleaceae bacterium]|nr:hypothetical protein [Defluviitaleaceae bacterium]
MIKFVKNVILFSLLSSLVATASISAYASNGSNLASIEIQDEVISFYNEYETITPRMPITIAQNNVPLFGIWQGPNGPAPANRIGWLNSGDHVTVLSQHGGYFQVRVNRSNGSNVNILGMIRIEALW